MKIKNLLVYSALLVGCITTNNSSTQEFRHYQNNNNMNFRNNNMMIQNNNQFMNNNMNNNNNMNFRNNNMYLQNNNQFINNNQVFNRNIAMQNNTQQFLINQNTNSKDGIITNWQNVNKSDWQLFQYNIINNSSARTSAIRALRSLFAGSGAQNFSGNNNEFSSRFAYAKATSGLIDFYSGNFNKIDRVEIVSTQVELFTMIANYYIMSLSSGYNISTIQNNLQTLSWQQINNFLPLLNNCGYQAYYQNYFLPRQLDNLKNYGRVSTNFLPNTITLQDWNNAITMVKRIDLAGCLKKMIKGVNVTSYFETFRKHEHQTSNTPIDFDNGVGKCAFNSMFQLLSSTLQRIKASNIASPITTGYFADFNKYLREKQARHGKQLRLINELWNFEKALSREQISDWNCTGNVLQAKNKLKEMQDIFSNEPFMTAFDLFSEIFPELKELYYKGDWLLNAISAVDAKSDQFHTIDHSKDYAFFSGPGNSAYGIGGVTKNMLFSELNSNKYMIDFDKQGRLFIYELEGTQLSVPGHNIAYTKYDNSTSNWRVVDSANANNNSTHGMQFYGIFQDKKFSYVQEYAGVAAYMFKKVSSQEFIRSMPHGLVL